MSAAVGLTSIRLKVCGWFEDDTGRSKSCLLTFEGFSSVGDVKFEAIAAGTRSQRRASEHGRQWHIKTKVTSTRFKLHLFKLFSTRKRQI